jgi:hypothetical protein
MLGSAQMLFLGILGEYLGRLYMQSKQRPLFVIAGLSRNTTAQSEFHPIEFRPQPASTALNLRSAV